MPTSLQLKAALRIGKTAKGRYPEHDFVCGRGERGDSVTAGGTAHFTSLIFSPLPAIVVAGRQEQIYIGTPIPKFTGSVGKFSHTLSVLLHEATKLLEMPAYNTAGKTGTEELLDIISYLKKQLPDFVNVSVGFGKKSKDYHLLLWTECDWEFELYNIDLGKAWNDLNLPAGENFMQQECARELLVRTIAMLSRKCDVTLWFNIHGGYLIEQVIENAGAIKEDLPFIDNEEEHKDYLLNLAAAESAVLDYTSGEAYEAERQLERWYNTDTATTEDLRRMAGSFGSLPKLQQVVELVCDLVDSTFSFSTFLNSRTLMGVDAISDINTDDDETFDSMCIADTVAVLWDENDDLSKTFMEITDANAREYHLENPTCILKIDSTTTEIDFPAFLIKREWPRKLQLTMQRIGELLGDITSKNESVINQRVSPL